MEPLVSVIMSTLNTKKEYLEEAISSVLNQTYRNIEFIIIVDGGNDEKIISNFSDSRIKIIKHQKTLGLTKSLNEAISFSRGKYIARMDSDDVSLVDRIKSQVEFMEKNKDIDITAMFYKRIGKDNKTIREIFNKPDELKCKLLFTNVIAHPSVMIKKSFLIEKSIQYNEAYTYSQDFELWTRCCKIGNICIIPKIGLKYRVHDKQISTEKFEIQSQLYYSVLKRNLTELQINQQNLDYLLELNGRKKVRSKKNLKLFIELIISQNEKFQIYNDEDLKKILRIYYVIACIKSKKVCLINRDFVKFIILKLKIRRK